MPAGLADTIKPSRSTKSRIKVTSSGRASVTPKHLVTTSEEEVHPRKKSKGIITIAQQKERLRNILKLKADAKEGESMKIRSKENVSPNPISVKSIKMPLKSTKSHSAHGAKTNDSGFASQNESSNRMKSFSSTATSSHSGPLTFKLNVPLQYISQPSRRQTTREDVEPFSRFPVHENYEDMNNCSVAIPETTSLPTSNETAETCSRSHFFDYGELASAPLSQSTPKQGQDRPPALLLNLEKLMTDVVKQNAELIQQNEDLRKQNEAIKKQNDEMKQLITEDLLQRNVDEAKLSETLFQPLQGFSLETVEQFDDLNTNHKLRKNLYNHLKTRGATKLREFIHKSLGVTMTDKLVSQFNWLGDAKSPKLGNTRVANVLYVAAKDCPYFAGPGSKNEFKNKMLDVLRCTKQRYRNHQKKLLSQRKNKATKGEKSYQQKINEDVNGGEEQDYLDNFSVDQIANELEGLENFEDSEGELNSDSDLEDEDFGDIESGNDAEGL